MSRMFKNAINVSLKILKSLIHFGHCTISYVISYLWCRHYWYKIWKFGWGKREPSMSGYAQDFEWYCMCVYTVHMFVSFSGVGRGMFVQVWCGEAQCHSEGGLWHSQTEERADWGVQTQSLPATGATWPAWYEPGKTYYRVIHPSISLSLHLWTFLTHYHPYILNPISFHHSSIHKDWAIWQYVNAITII